MPEVIKFLQGQQVYLRPYQPDDAEVIYRSTFDPETRKLTGTQALFTLIQVQEFLEKSAQAKDRVDLAIVTQAEDLLVGEVVLNNINHLSRHANIRIALFDAAQFGRGYGTEALELMLGYGFGRLNLHRIELGVYEFNPRALHVYEKLGFKQEGILRDALFYEHRYVNEVIMSILEDEYREKRGIQR